MNAKRMTKRSTKAVQAQEYIIFMIARGENPDTFKSLWENYIADLATGGVKIDIDELVESILSQAYSQNNSLLQAYAEKAGFYNKIHQQGREEIHQLRSLQQDIASRIAAWEEKLNTIGDDAQLANIDLQNALQKQQQLIQMLSNISKMLHDTALAVIRKIG